MHAFGHACLYMRAKYMYDPMRLLQRAHSSICTGHRHASQYAPRSSKSIQKRSQTHHHCRPFRLLSSPTQMRAINQFHAVKDNNVSRTKTCIQNNIEFDRTVKSSIASYASWIPLLIRQLENKCGSFVVANSLILSRKMHVQVLSV